MQCMLIGLLFAASLAALSIASPGVYTYKVTKFHETYCTRTTSELLTC